MDLTWSGWGRWFGGVDVRLVSAPVATEGRFLRHVRGPGRDPGRGGGGDAAAGRWWAAHRADRGGRDPRARGRRHYARGTDRGPPDLPTPFDRGAITSLIAAMDDSIDEM